MRAAVFTVVCVLAAALITILCVVAVVLPFHHHHHGCEYPFSCGHLHNISYPFRRRGDPHRCGVSSYELDCSSNKATIQINTGTYYITSINYTDNSFWVIDANLQLDEENSTNSSSCLPLPRSDQIPYIRGIPGSHDSWDLVLDRYVLWASFVSCSQELTNSSIYMPVDCLSTSSSFVYVSNSDFSEPLPFSEPLSIGGLEPSCGHLATIPFGGRHSNSSIAPGYRSFEDLFNLMKGGFAVQFPTDGGPWTNWYGFIEECLNESISLSSSRDEPLPSTGIKDRIVDIISMDFRFWACTIVLCRYLFAPLAVMIFLTHKYWKTRIAIDAVEKFLRMQQMLGPKRYAYTDIIAITSHFRDKLGQGGYGSVYKGVLLPGHVHVAIKMLTNGNSSCNGEDFISEVATIGRIHHVNVVRLVGFCSEEMRRALVYDFMPRGSLDKYIFSSENRFSWDKLNEIALGIARGINYLHQGCDMQILHFDIKPHNILLDDNFVPKVADFGLAKLYPRDKSFVSERALRGTVGYMAPEMVSRSFGVISSKSDVYSFGMLLLEMAGGRKNADPDADPNASKAYYPSWVYNQLTIDRQQVQAGEISSAAAVATNMHDLERKLCLVGLWCIQMKSHDRPTMSEAIEMLEGDVDALQVPPRPFFCDGDCSMPPAMDSYLYSSELTAISEEDGME